MMGTGFLGFSNIAPNELNKNTKNNYSNQNNRLELQSGIIIIAEQPDRSLPLPNLSGDNLNLNESAHQKQKQKQKDVILLKALAKKFPNHYYPKDKPSQFVPTKRKYSTLSNSRLFSTERSSVIDEFIKEKNLNPVFVYENLDDDLTRKQIVKDTKGLSGIYLILNKENLNYYIGSASTGKFNSRFTSHLFYFTGSKIVKSAVKKYKLHSFCFMVLELFPYIVNQENNKKLLDLEDFYLKSLLPDYNILTEAGSSFGYKHSDITRLKMKSGYSQERRDQIGKLNLGKTLSQATIEAIRASALNRKKVVYSEQALLNMKKKSRPILVKELSGIVYGEYASIVEASEAFKCSTKTIQRALKKETKFLKKR